MPDAIATKKAGAQKPKRRKRRKRQLPKISILCASKLLQQNAQDADDRSAAHSAGKRSSSAKPFTAKQVESVQQQFLEFERKNFWNSGHVTVPGKEPEVAPSFNIHNDTASGRNVPDSLKKVIASHCGPLTTKIAHTEVSSDGNTVKLIVELQDGYQVESVIMRHKDRKTGRHTRATLCVSSQVGCKMGCKFCATGTLGELGNLTSGEILEQLVHANRINDTTIRNVVFMGMGEPLNNYDNVTEAVRFMVNVRGFALAASRVTVSTVGIVPRMEQLVADLPQVSMALSLHAPTQEMRADIVPAAKGWKMERLMAALDEHTRLTGRAALIQYILLAGLNDTPLAGQQLAKLLKGRKVKLNLIPYNPNFAVGIMEFNAPTEDGIARFVKQMRAAGVFTTVRKEMGQDVSGACGQLALTVKKKAEAGGGGQHNGPNSASGDIEDLMDGDAQKVTKGASIRRRSERSTRTHARGGTEVRGDGQGVEEALVQPHVRHHPLFETAVTLLSLLILGLLLREFAQAVKVTEE